MEVGPKINTDEFDFSEHIDYFESLDLSNLIKEFISIQQKLDIALDVEPPTENSIKTAHYCSKKIGILRDIIIDECVELYKTESI